MQVSEQTLRTTQTVDLDTTLDSGQCFRWRRHDDGRWIGVLGEDIVQLTTSSSKVHIVTDSKRAETIKSEVFRYLRLDDDLRGIQDRLSCDPNLAQSIESYPGLRILRQDPWETLIGFILSAVSNINRISMTMETLSRSLGKKIVMGNEVRHSFPTAEILANTNEVHLRELGCGFRAPYVIHAARAVHQGTLRLGELSSTPYPDVLTKLTDVYGVGDKIADCVMLFSLDHTEAFPVDRWIQRALQEWYGPLDVRSYWKCRDWAQKRFGDDAGYANHYLFWRRRQLGI